MKQLLILLITISCLAVSCKKEEQPQPMSAPLAPTEVYTGTYVLNTPNPGSYDTVRLYYKYGSYRLSKLCVNGGDSLEIEITNLKIVLPQQKTAPTFFWMEGRGGFHGNQMMLDYTCDRGDYDPAFHKEYYSVYTKL